MRLLPIARGAFKYPIGARNVHRPSSSAAFIPARVRSDRQSLSNCANAARTPSINFPVDVSSMGSVAERSEIPSDCRRERSAKWSYLSRAKRVRLNTTTKCTRPLHRCRDVPGAVPRVRVETVPRKRSLPESANGSTLPAMVGAVIYVRVSTKEQTENLSLPTQLRACEEYCRRQGYEVLERFHEEGESAKSTDRSQLQNLLTFCRLNKGRVPSWSCSTSRASRSYDASSRSTRLADSRRNSCSSRSGSGASRTGAGSPSRHKRSACCCATSFTRA